MDNGIDAGIMACSGSPAVVPWNGLIDIGIGGNSSGTVSSYPSNDQTLLVRTGVNGVLDGIRTGTIGAGGEASVWTAGGTAELSFGAKITVSVNTDGVQGVGFTIGYYGTSYNIVGTDINYTGPPGLNVDCSTYNTLQVTFESVNIGVNYNVLIRTNAGLYQSTGVVNSSTNFVVTVPYIGSSLEYVNIGCSYETGGAGSWGAVISDVRCVAL